MNPETNDDTGFAKLQVRHSEEIFKGDAGIIHRAYYALKDTPLVAKRTGENTSAVFGFTNTLLTILDELKPILPRSPQE